MDKRSEAMRQAVTMLEAGGSVQVFGTPGIGKSMFLARVAERFEHRGWKVLRLRGNRSFSSSPLMCLALAGVSAAEPGRSGAVAAAISELESRLPGNRSLIVVDEAELLDEASGGVISELLSRHQVSLILSRTSVAVQDLSHSFDWLADASGMGIRLGPMHYDDLNRIVSRHAAGPIGAAAMSQIFSSSGGNPGLASAVTASAVHEGRLVERDGEWVLTGSLWSDSLTPYVESILSKITPPQWDALEMLALLGMVEATTFFELNGTEIPVELEEHSLIEFYPSDGQLLVTVTPPLLVDYFRNRSSVARRYRLGESLKVRFPSDSQSLARLQPLELSSSVDAPFVRLVHEHLQNRLIVAQLEWNRAPSKATAAQLIETSITSGASADELQSLFTLSESLQGDESAAVKWALLRAEYFIYFRAEHEKAIRYLEAEATRFPRLGPLLSVYAFEIRSSVQRIASSFDLLDPSDDGLDPKVRSAIHAALGMHFTLQGELAAASHHLDAADLYTGRAESVDRIALHVLSNYFGGEPHDARAIGERGHNRAIVSFSSVEIRGYNYLNAIMGLLDGRTRSVEEAIRVTLSLGEPLRRPPFVHITLLVLGTVLAARRGDTIMVRSFSAQLSALDAPDSPVPGGSRSWAHAQVLASDGQSVEAADMMEADADRTWEKGFLLAAAFNYLLALEFDPTLDRVAKTRDRIRSVESDYFDCFLDYVTAIASQDAAALLTAGARFARAGRFGHALSAYRYAGRLSDSDGDSDASDRARALWAEARTAMPHDDYSEIVVDAHVPRLTSRELQIATLAVEGRSNQEIANELVLSVRTVESHMHRVMKKVGAESRSDLKSVLPDGLSGTAWD